MRAARTRAGGGGVEFVYSETEERRFERRRVMREIIPLMAESLADMEDPGVSPTVGPPKPGPLRAAALGAPAASPRAARLRDLAERLRAVSNAR